MWYVIYFNTKQDATPENMSSSLSKPTNMANKNKHASKTNMTHTKKKECIWNFNVVGKTL